MRFPLRLFALITSLLLLLQPSATLAYSYGATETEPIVEAYKAAVAAANSGDWEGAAAAFEPIRAEVEKDAGGPEATAAWDAAVAARDADLAARVFRSVVYLNMQRRLSYARQAIEDYPTAKMLVNRAMTTYEALSPLVTAQDEALDTQVRRDLDEAFSALGNPGVLGVGARDPQPQVYDAATERIVSSLAPLFPTDFAAMVAGGSEEQPAEGAGGGETSAEGGQEPADQPEQPADSDPSEPAEAGSPEDGPAEDPSSVADEPGDPGDQAGEATGEGETQSADASSNPSEPSGTESSEPAQQDTAQAESQPQGGAGWIWFAVVAILAAGGLILFRRLSGRGA